MTTGGISYKVCVCTESCFRPSSVTLQDPIVMSFDGRLFRRTLGIWRNKALSIVVVHFLPEYQQESKRQPNGSSVKLNPD